MAKPTFRRLVTVKPAARAAQRGEKHEHHADRPAESEPTVAQGHVFRDSRTESWSAAPRAQRATGVQRGSVFRASGRRRLVFAVASRSRDIGAPPATLLFAHRLAVGLSIEGRSRGAGTARVDDTARSQKDARR